MRFDAETPAATQPKTRVQPSLDFAKDEPVRRGAHSGPASSPPPAAARSTFEARPRVTMDSVTTASLRTASVETTGSPAVETPAPATRTPLSKPGAGEVMRKGADSGLSNDAAAEAPGASHEVVQSRTHEAETKESSSVSVSAAEKPHEACASSSASMEASSPGKVREAETMASASARASAPVSLSQATHASPSMPGEKALTSTSAPTLRSIGSDAKMNARPVASATPNLKASVPSPDGQTAIPWSELQYIGPFARCFLLFEYQQQMLAIDQHAFHERVLYERLIENPDILRRTQPLLMPEVLVFSPTETERLVHMKDALDALGIQIQGVSDTEIEVTSVPSLLVNKDLNSLLAAILAGRDRPSELAHDVLATMACHAAVRAGEELPEPELKALMREAESVDFYHNCPHGRRVFRWWKLAQVASWFDR
jgi:DNA mismatch repair protein MutL